MIVTLKTDGNPAENTRILQQCLDQGGTVRIDRPGIYDFEGGLTFGDHTALECGAGVSLRRVGDCTQRLTPFLSNKGLYDDSVNHNIRLEGVHLIVNGVDYKVLPRLLGMRGQVGFSGVRQLVIRDFECHDLGEAGYGILICDFEDVLLENLFIEGRKDGVHFARGSKFTIRHAKFRTFDDPIALNAFDYCTSNYRRGWIEDGLIEDCYDLDDRDTTGFFCRMLAGSWCDWYENMPFQNSTLAVYEGKLYAASVRPIERRAEPLRSQLPPPRQLFDPEQKSHVGWRVVQDHDGHYDAGCRRITFRDIHLKKKRNVAFAFELSTGLWAVSVPDGLPIPVQEDILFDGIHSCSQVGVMLQLGAPVKNLRISNSVIDGDAVESLALQGRERDYFPTDVTFCSTSFNGGALLKGKFTDHIRLGLHACTAPEDAVLSCAGNARIESGGLRIQKQ